MTAANSLGGTVVVVMAMAAGWCLKGKKFVAS